MKLIFCKNCGSIYNLDKVVKNCLCGRTGGRYVDDLQAEYWGEFAVPLGMTNGTFACAVNNQPERGRGYEYEAFVIPKECSTMHKFVKESEFYYPLVKELDNE